MEPMIAIQSEVSEKGNLETRSTNARLSDIISTYP